MRYIYSTLLLLLVSCKIFKTKFIDAPIGMTINEGYSNFTYEDFPNEDVNKGDTDYKERFTDSNHRIGKIRGGYKVGKWLAGNVDFDDKMDVESEGATKEEYFKSGLRDSIYRCFGDNEILYETTFKKGTGLWKEYHSNNQLYFEIYTKDGYFKDTLKLHDEKGKIFEKRLYQKDTLVYYVSENGWCLKYRYNPDHNIYLEVDSYDVKNLKQGAFRNTFRYKTKEEFDDDYFAKNTLKR